MAVYFHRKDTEGVDLDEIEVNYNLQYNVWNKSLIKKYRKVFRGNLCRNTRMFSWKLTI